MRKKVVDLYAILQIHKDASPREIKEAFRKAVKKCHPDNGGDAQEFHRVQSAYVILSNPEKRSFYNKTGCVKESKSETHAIVAKILMEIIDGVLISLKQDLFTVNLINLIVEKLEKDGQEIEDKRKIIRKNLGVVNQLKKRTTRKEEDSNYPPVMLQYLEQKKTEFLGVLRQLNQSMSYNKIAILMIKEYKFDYIKMQQHPIYEYHSFSFGMDSSTTSGN